MRKSFTWFLSLMVLLTAFATHGYAQEEQETVELYAETVSDCYNETNNYTVAISVRDFINLSRFELNLEFDDEVFSFEGESWVHASLLGGITITPSGGIITMVWDGDATTIGDNLKTDVILLDFSVVGYANNVSSSFSSDLEWGTTEFWYALPAGEDLVNTDISMDGSLLVEVGIGGVEVGYTTETCAGGDVTLSVTTPDAAFYLFNEDPDPANWTDAWSTSPDYDVTAGETVTVRVKDANGCISLKQTFNVPETLDPVSFEVTTQDPACPGENGSVVFSATGGVAPYTYYISENADGSDAVTRTNFQFSYAPGTYYVAVQDANDCADLTDTEYWQVITITANEDVLELTAVPAEVSCKGGTNGSIAVTVTNVTEVSLNGVNWFAVVEGGYTFNNLLAGTYTVHGRNENGCTISAPAVVVEPDAITFDMEIVDTSCGGEDDGQIIVSNIVGGTATYTLVIAESGNITSESGVGTEGFTFTGLKPTYYSLTITDSNGCVVEYINPNNTQNVISVQSPEDIQFVVNIVQPDCTDEDALVQVLNITGGTGTYEILFNGVESEEVAVNTFVWEYPYAALTVTVQDLVGEGEEACPVSQDFDAEDVVNPAVLTASVANVFAPTCIDGNDGNIYLLVTGGTKPYTYSINGSSYRPISGELAIIRVGVGVHEIMVVDANGCEIETEIEVPVEMEENVIEAFSDLHIDCFGDKTGTISVNFLSWADGLTGEGGQPVRGIQFYVENEAGQVTSFMPSNGGGTTTTFNAGTYIVWVVDQYTCESNLDTVVVTQNPELLIDAVVSNAASCFETFEGSITIYATGGNASAMNMLEYAVVNNEGALGNINPALWLPFTTYNNVDYDPALSTVSFNVDGGTYWIAVRDDGCDEKWWGPIEVEGYEELLVDEDDIETTDPLCFGDDNGTITVPMSAVSGGAGAYKFTLLEWVGAGEGGEWVAMEDYTELATGEFTGLPSGVYAVLVEDSEDCPSYTTDYIELADPAVLAFTTTYYHFSCEGTNDGIITLDVTGGTGNYWYAINNQNAWVAFGNEVTTKTYIATEPGTFTIWVKDANDCITEPVEVTILQPEALDAEITVNQDVSCYGGSDGAISVEGLGGWDGMSVFQFKVNDGVWTSATTFIGLPAGDHMLYVRDVNGYSEPYQALDCEYAVEFTVEQPAPITYDVVIEDVSCKDGEDGTFTVTILSGGTPWIDGANVNHGYQVRLTGNNYNEGPFWTGADYTYTFEDLAHSHYTLYITDANGCELPAPMQPSPTEGPYTTRESWEVQEPATYLTLDAEWVQDATCYNAEDGQFLLHADGGTAPYKYWAGLSVEPDGHILVPAAPAEGSSEWQTSNEFNVGAGTWVVWVLDANGCIVGGEYENGIPVNKWRVKIEQPDSILWDFHRVGDPLRVHYVQPSCFGAWDGAIHLVNISGGSGTYNAHVWGTSAAGEPVDTVYTDIEIEGSLYWLRGVPASDEDGFQVTVMDNNDCISTVRTIYVDQPDQLVVELIKSEGSFTCSDAVEGWIEAVATGGTGVYQYQLLKNGVVHTTWQNIASAFLVQIGNEFTVEVRDANGCEAEATIDIQQVEEVVIVEIENRSCFGMMFPKAVVTATAEPGRALFIRHQKVEGASSLGPWSAWEPLNEEEGEGTHVYTDELTFGDDNESDGHYNFQVRDEEWCLSEVIFKTFVPVQNAVVMTYTVGDEEECSAVVQITNITGGFGPYVVMVNDSVMTEMTFTLPRGTYVLKAIDSQMCTDEVTIEIVGEYVTREIEVETFIGYNAEFVDEEAGVDTMLAIGTYEYIYMFGECERTLIVTVVEVPRPLTIAEVQGEVAVSPWVGDVVKVTGTVTGVSAGEGFFMQDANAAWSGIWVEYQNASDLEVGDGVEVVGVVAEVVTVTTISASEVTAIDAPLAVEAVAVDSPSDVKAEMYESLLVKVAGARATAADEGNGEWTIYYENIDNVIVNDWLYAYEPVEGNFYNVSGIVNTRLEAYKLEPRMESDIEDLTATPAPIVQGAEFKVYPNPFNDRIYIDNNDRLTRVVISNIAGQRVLDMEYPTREIRTSNLVSGVYVVSMFTESGLAKTERIVKR